jgi:hypothetical protein
LASLGSFNREFCLKAEIRDCVGEACGRSLQAERLPAVPRLAGGGNQDLHPGRRNAFNVTAGEHDRQPGKHTVTQDAEQILDRWSVKRRRKRQRAVCFSIA